MVRCIVKSCPNKKNRGRKTEVAFFGLPKDKIIRKSWFQKIKEVHLPSNVEHAKICSVHFTKESFHIGWKQRRGQCTNARRLLLPTAIPTIMLSAIENRDVLPINVHRNTDEESSSNENSVSSFQIDASGSSTTADNESKLNEVEQCELVTYSLHPENDSLDPLSLSETIVNIKTPKNHVRRERVNKRKICEMPQNTSHASDSIFNNTFPRRSQRVKHLHPYRVTVSSAYTQMRKQVTASVKKLKISSRKVLGECHSEENTSSYIRKQRFMMENYNDVTDSTHKSTQNEDHITSIKLLKAELEHQCINQFHLQSRCHHFNELKKIEKECQALRLQLVQKDEDIQILIKEKEELQVKNNDLYTKLTVSDLEKRNLEKTTENKIVVTV